MILFNFFTSARFHPLHLVGHVRPWRRAQLDRSPHGQSLRYLFSGLRISGTGISRLIHNPSLFQVCTRSTCCSSPRARHTASSSSTQMRKTYVREFPDFPAPLFPGFRRSRRFRLPVSSTEQPAASSTCTSSPDQRNFKINY